ncbi:MAG TPA: HNH endonuclease [Candidatus Microbacterium stercoravium]|uniref:HNH endonuclease n=1 Tax=Candidatus Microbacterium stercoravium TaxID=2838697 RepID=A0A9D2H501_9MICO|nr:HNH endonuclease [Candidatus Microbacterium stercoravium]
MSRDAFDDSLVGLTGPQCDEARRALASLERAKREAALVEARRVRALATLARLADAQAAGSSNSHARADARRSLAAEAATALRVSPSEARDEMGLAETLHHEYPTTLAALSDGSMSLAHAHHVAVAGSALDPGARASLDEHAAVFAQTRTTRQFAKIVKKQAADLDARSLKERHDAERARRYVRVRDCGDGMSLMQIYGPSIETRAVLDIITTRAQAIRRDRLRAMREYEHQHGPLPDEGWTSPESGRADVTDPLEIAATDARTLMQIRVDLLHDVLLTAAPTAHELAASGTGATLEHIRPTVHVTIPVEQLLDPDQGVGWVEGGEVASPDTLRILAGRAAGWERLFIRPSDGTIAAVDHYRPTAAQKRALLARDMTCRIPGCETAARKCDIDHGHDYARGGRTSLDNLEALCPGHHQMKHQTGWRVRQRAGGKIEFTTPLGRTLTDDPISRVFFRDTASADAHAGTRAPVSTRGAGGVKDPGVPRDTGRSSDTGRARNSGGTKDPGVPKGTRGARDTGGAGALGAVDSDARLFLADRADNRINQLQREVIRERRRRADAQRVLDAELASLGPVPDDGWRYESQPDAEGFLIGWDAPERMIAGSAGVRTSSPSS